VFADGYDYNPDADHSDLSSSAPEADSTPSACALRLRVDTELQLFRKEKQIGQDADSLAYWRNKMIEYPLIGTSCPQVARIISVICRVRASVLKCRFGS
jgi:hypothetical protein